jgi:tetratricopeptide (TPR) repeat protein
LLLEAGLGRQSAHCRVESGQACAPGLRVALVATTVTSQEFMASLQDQYDDAMFDFSMGDFGACIAKLESILAEDSQHFDAQLSLGMAFCRLGDFDRAIAEGHKAEKLNPQDQLVHTNLSVFYMKAGDKATAEHHGLKARVAGWKGDMNAPATPKAGDDPSLSMADAPKPETVRLTARKQPEAGVDDTKP